MKRWTEHFHEVLNQPEPTMLLNFEQETNIASVDISAQDITAQEVIKAINSQKNNVTWPRWHSSRTLETWENYIGRGTDTVIQYHLA